MEPLSIAVIVLPVSSGILLVHAFFDRLVPAHLMALSGAEQADLVMQCTCFCAYALPLPVMYAMGVAELHATPWQRWHGTSVVIERALLLHIGATLYETVIFIWHRKPFIYHVHHVVVVYAYSLALCTGELLFWGAWSGMVEMSNANLCVLKIMLLTGLGRGSKLETVNGAMLWLIYLAVRVVSLPVMLMQFVHDAIYSKGSTWSDEAPASVVLLQWSTPICVFLIWAISLIWFGALTRGMLKALRGGDATEDQKKEYEQNLQNNKQR